MEHFSIKSTAKNLPISPRIPTNFSFMKHTYTFLFLTIGLLCFSSALFGQSGSFMHDGILREYNLHLPNGYDANTPTPLVLNLHGYSSNNLQQEYYTGFNQVSDINNFIVVYPNGTFDNEGFRYWNSGFISSGVDDVGFLSALIDTLANQYNIETTQVYSTGMSNGGFMSYRLACELEDKIAAIASVTGAFPYEIANTCQNTRPVSVMQISGTADPTVNYNGVAGSYYSAEGGIDYWAQKNNTLLVPKSVDLEDISTQDNCTTTHFYYGEGDNGTEVELYRVNGGEHTWPGASFIIGVTSEDFNASRTIWSFFSRHSLNGTLVSGTKEPSWTNNVSIFPNPTEDILQLQVEWKESGTLEVFNLMGQRILQQHLMPNTNNLSISSKNWSTGLYVIKISDSNGKSWGYKVMKK